MCQWKFFVFRYSANTSARMAFMAPAMSLVAERVRSVGVVSGASRLCRSSAVFVELFLLILFFPLWVVFVFFLKLRSFRANRAEILLNRTASYLSTAGTEWPQVPERCC